MKKENCGKRIKDRLEQLDMRQSDLAKLTGISKGTISQYINGKYLPTQERVEIISKALNVDPAWLMGFDVPMKRQLRWNLFGEKEAGSPVYTAAAGEGVLNDGYPSETADFALDPDQALFTVKGRSMEPTLQDGDTVVVTIQNVIDYQRQLALVKVNGNESTIKRVEIKDDGLLLIGDNVDVYAPHFFTAHEVQTLPVTIEGIVKRLIREID